MLLDKHPQNKRHRSSRLRKMFELFAKVKYHYSVYKTKSNKTVSKSTKLPNEKLKGR